MSLRLENKAIEVAQAALKDLRMARSSEKDLRTMNQEEDFEDDFGYSSQKGLYASLKQSQAFYAEAFSYFVKGLGYSWNTRENRPVELQALSSLDIEQQLHTFALITGVDYPEVRKVVTALKANLQHVDPVAQELNRIAEANPGPWLGWDTMAADIFGTSDPLHQIFISKWLISAVARAYNPGCRADGMLVLQGDQGVGKSSFFEILGGRYSSILQAHIKDADRDRLMMRAWMIELAEVEGITRKKEVEELKAMITAPTAEHRKLYQDDIQQVVLPCILGATANSDQILNDATGSRRYWVIPMTKRLDREVFAKLRPLILAEAVRRYRAKDTWHLTEDEITQLNQANKAFTVDSSTDEPLEMLHSYYQDEAESIFIPNSVLYLALGYKGDLPLNVSRKISAKLRALGWTAGFSKRVNGAKVKGFIFGSPSDAIVETSADHLYRLMTLEHAMKAETARTRIKVQSQI